MTINEIRKISKENNDIKRNEAFSLLVKFLDEIIYEAAQEGKYKTKRTFYLNYFETLEFDLALKYYTNQGYKIKVQKTPSPYPKYEQAVLIIINWSED